MPESVSLQLGELGAHARTETDVLGAVHALRYGGNLVAQRRVERVQELELARAVALARGHNSLGQLGGALATVRVVRGRHGEHVHLRAALNHRAHLVTRIGGLRHTAGCQHS